MNHVSKANLIKLAAGEPSEDRQREIEEHLKSCSECRAAFEELLTIRNVLDQWQMAIESPDLWPAINQRLDTRQPVIIRPIWTRLGQISRIAAAVVFGIGLGYGGARVVTDGGAESRPVLPTTSPEEALDALGFHFIESPSATGLFLTVFDLANETPEEGGTP